MHFYKKILISLVICLTGCYTTIGIPQQEKLSRINFSEPETIRFCILKDVDVPQDTVDKLIEAIKLEFTKYKISVDTPWTKPWKRPGFEIKSIKYDIIVRPLESPCDRLLAFVGTNVWDFFVGAEEYGAVETISHTKGYVFAQWYSISEFLFYSPKSAAVHESYHFLGCKHNSTMGDCYDQIKRIKDSAADQRKNGNDFFPSTDQNGELLSSRNSVNTIINNTYALEYINRGNDNAKQMLYDQAISDYTKAIELNPKSEVAYNNRGVAYYRKGLYDQAIADFSKDIELNPRDEKAYLKRGSTYMENGQYNQAIADDNKAIELNPQNTNAHADLGYAHLRLGKIQQAADYFNKAIELKPQDPWANYNMSCFYSLTNNYQEACKYLKKAIDLGYNNWEHIKKDKDLNNIRQFTCYREIVNQPVLNTPLHGLSNTLSNETN